MAGAVAVMPPVVGNTTPWNVTVWPRVTMVGTEVVKGTGELAPEVVERIRKIVATEVASLPNVPRRRARSRRQRVRLGCGRPMRGRRATK